MHMIAATFPGSWFWNPSGKFYVFWSGIGSDMTYLAVIGAAWHHLNCHAEGCFRLGKHAVEGTPYKTCAKHHPGIPGSSVTAEQIKDAHHKAAASGAAQNAQ